MNTISITVKSIIGLTISILISIITIAIMVIGIIYLSKNSHAISEVTIGAVGNISGGIIGGIVAYIVASYQMKKATDEQEKLNMRSAYSHLRILHEEINHNAFLFGQATETTNFDGFKPIFSSKINNLRWEQLATQIGPEIDEALFKTLFKYYNAVTILKDPNLVSMDVILQTSNLGNQLIPEIDNKIQILSNKIQ
ncbi:hypothetical protein [Bacillus toyonensis]|uniref:hypothetical protein n=1 Tax=Bacillus toyonensis TaxID=155322 RepID=UPI000BF242A2|nr:hypothetical protein [Bacillus toyonensis]PEK52301.1 hypothetical protein CN592_09260 [Bacillus toyonensis]PEO31376.1 hypothetical protein CN569_17445 [Bacillus toyonensis]